eukprot:8651726-Alexandrium_andersonii.AAC.1
MASRTRRRQHGAHRQSMQHAALETRSSVGRPNQPSSADDVGPDASPDCSEELCEELPPAG